MSLVTFEPNDYEEDLISNALEPTRSNETLAQTLFVSHIENSAELLPKLFRDGVRYLVCFENHQAFAVLQNSKLVSEIAHKVGSPTSMSVFEIQRRANPTDDEDDFKLTSEDLRPDPKKWFETFLQRYNNWKEAWWREVLQNSVDTCLEALDKHGRKGKIDCDIHTFEGNDEVQVNISDNGMGMDKKTLIEAFLTPGGSGKRELQLGKTMAGGLGKAKEMLFHAWPWWSVWTQMEGKPGYYVEAKYGPYFDGNLIKSERRDRPMGPGTSVSVSMKADQCVEKDHLVKFITYSDFQIKLTFRRIHNKADGTAELLEQEHLKAENEITVDNPVRILYRSDGSPWARIYHMPHAKRFKEVTVRANGLFLFTAPGEYSFPGKIIVELTYKPRGHQWDSETKSWVAMSPERAKRQRITEFGPLEILTESRDQLQYTFKNQLDRFFQDLTRKPEVALKPPRKIQRTRVVNQRSDQIDFSKLFERVEPKQLVEKPQAAVEQLRQIVERTEDQVLRDFARQLVRGDIPDPTQIQSVFSTNQLIHIKNTDPKVLAEICKTVSSPVEPKFEGEELDEEEDSPSAPSRAINFLSLIDYLDKIQISAVDTSVDSKLYDFYKEHVIPDVMEELKGNSPSSVPFNSAQSVIKVLNWAPDFIFSDETSKPTPPAPRKFYPSDFTPKEKQLAKFWVETIRIAHLLQGIEDPNLQVGFLFENPGSLNYLGEFVSSSGSEIGRDSDDIGAFRAVLIAPAQISMDSKSKQWSHRYSLGDARDISEIVAIAFHEVVHSKLNLSSDIDHGHDTDFAVLLTKALALAMRHRPIFNKLARYCSELYPIKGPRREESEDTKKITAGTGYYQVSCRGVRGRHAKFNTLAAALQHADRVIKEKNTDCYVDVYYLPETGDPRHVTRISRYDIHLEQDIEDFSKRASQSIIDAWDREDLGRAEDLWRRKRSMKRRT